MRKRRIGYAAWLLLAACLYFFENNTGTRVVLLCSVLFPLIPSLRAALFQPDRPAVKNPAETLTVKVFRCREEEEPGDIRPYVPGDPVRRIHWKLSAKKDELLVRSVAAVSETAEEERKTAAEAAGGRKRKPAALPAALSAAGVLLCALLLLLVPEARHGMMELCNRLFAASEAANRYAYHYFTVPEGQGVLMAAVLLLCAAALLLALAALKGGRPAALGIMAAATGFQVYFGLSFPARVNIPLYSLLALRMLRRPVSLRSLAVLCALCLGITAAVALLLPGVYAATETASEAARDYLARIAEQITGTAPEAPEEETETRHVHNRSLESGNGPAGTEQEFRLVTVEEEQISRPGWTDWVRVILLLVLTVAVVTLPFLPFLLLNARKKKAREIRKTFASEDAGEAVRSIFTQVIRWLEAAGCGAGNRLYRDWGSRLPAVLPARYADRFARCAADYEEAVYSDHALPEEKRRDALDLLEETEAALWNAADWKQRLYLKYWMCLRE